MLNLHLLFLFHIKKHWHCKKKKSFTLRSHKLATITLRKNLIFTFPYKIIALSKCFYVNIISSRCAAIAQELENILDYVVKTCKFTCSKFCTGQLEGNIENSSKKIFNMCYRVFPFVLVFPGAIKVWLLYYRYVLFVLRMKPFQYYAYVYLCTYLYITM